VTNHAPAEAELKRRTASRRVIIGTLLTIFFCELLVARRVDASVQEWIAASA
jgi:hypothetical protein